MISPEESKASKAARRFGWPGWRRKLVWSACVGLLVMLAALRTATGAQYEFASLALLPVMLIAWVSGRAGGLVVSVLASATWTVGDFASRGPADSVWILWANCATRLIIYCMVAVLAAKVRQQIDREHEGATRDALTGLSNRRHLMDTGGLQVERSRRYAEPLAMLFLDLDNFKQLNDERGHATGDEALRTTAQGLLGAVRSIDTVARLGGDEFVVLFTPADPDAALQAARRIAASVNAALARFPGLSASVGVAWFGQFAPAMQTMLKAADGVMYRAKRQGRGTVVVEDCSGARS